MSGVTNCVCCVRDAQIRLASQRSGGRVFCASGAVCWCSDLDRFVVVHSHGLDHSAVLSNPLDDDDCRRSAVVSLGSVSVGVSTESHLRGTE